ncbi:MAG TPA: polyprenyl synthetase family protein [Aggregatilineales bacterium]|nr:polyprenyl synthetase family protein [Aggregatilineales bacterium]
MGLSTFFDRYLPLIEADLQAVLTPPAGSPPLFYRMLHYHMGWVGPDGEPSKANGGKRIRPVLCLLTCAASGGPLDAARPPAAAIELIHNFSLLHDDIQDRSPLRRNRPTAWSIWGEAQAINAGDSLFTLAHLAIPRLADGRLDGETQARMLTITDETCLALTCGQHLDISFEERTDVTVDEYLEMIGGKTAALLSAAARLGALAAGVDESVQAHYAAFGHYLGMAFQVLDDILDIWGDPALTGKEAAIDIRQRKKSLPVLYGLERSAELRDLYATPAPFDEAQVEQAVSLLDAVGARDYAESLARRYSDETLEHLDAAQPQGDAGQALYALVDRLLHRDR